jgi:hypothetical protein
MDGNRANRLMTGSRWLPLIVTLVTGAGPVTAQEPTVSPHGTLQGECRDCHSPEGWRPARVGRDFDHAKWSRGFALEGGHLTASCSACHASLDFSGAPTDCASCHTDVHQGELGSDCARCHTPRSFVDRAGMTRLHQSTRFPLTGAHRVTDCDLCHTPSPQGQLTFVNRGSECQDCHLSRFLATTDPPHESSGFPRDCAQCHAITVWSAARYNHNDTDFPLTGRHRSIACASCHVNGGYQGAPTTCVGCHQQDYDATTDPAHVISGFSTDCASCHNTSGWTGANFNHDGNFFPIYSGTHRNKWTSCASCHPNSASFAEFTCTTCHEHSQSLMDPKHSERSGYRYDSQACYSCHRNGQGDD